MTSNVLGGFLADHGLNHLVFTFFPMILGMLTKNPGFQDLTNRPRKEHTPNPLAQQFMVRNSFHLEVKGDVWGMRLSGYVGFPLEGCSQIVAG